MLDRVRIVVHDFAVTWGVHLLESNGEADDVHLLLSVPPTVLPSVLVNHFKTVSSRYLRKEFDQRICR